MTFTEAVGPLPGVPEFIRQVSSLPQTGLTVNRPNLGTPPYLIDSSIFDTISPVPFR